MMAEYGLQVVAALADLERNNYIVRVGVMGAQQWPLLLTTSGMLGFPFVKWGLPYLSD